MIFCTRCRCKVWTTSQPLVGKKENTVLKTSIIAVSSKRNELHKYKVRRSVNVFFSARISLSSQEGPWSNNTLFGIARQSTTTICWEDILMNGFRWFPHGRLSAADVPPKWLFPHSVSVKSYCLSCPQELRLCARLLFSYPPRLIYAFCHIWGCEKIFAHCRSNCVRENGAFRIVTVPIFA